MQHIPFPTEFIYYLESNTLVGIKGGTDREKFLDIWMVHAEGRVFARSWAKSSKSWFTAFQEQGIGQIRYGENILNVTGTLMLDASTNLLADKAYQEKYTQEHNLPYVKGITQPENHAYTMEFHIA